MTREELRAAVLEALAEVAPEIDAGKVEARVPLRDQLDLDSVDVLNFLVVLEKRLGVSVPETDYAAVATLDGCVEYLMAHKPPA